MKLMQKKQPLIAVFVLALVLVAPSGVLGQDDELDSESIGELRRQAERGVAEAQFALGDAYALGQGVPHDEAEAVAWWRLAAAQGHATAQVALGGAYANGWGGVPQDYQVAVTWYHRAATQGDAEAHYNLGFMYANGRGVSQDDAEAVRWYPLGRRAGALRRAVQPRVYARQRSGRVAGRRGSRSVVTAWPPNRATPRRNSSSDSCTRMVGACRKMTPMPPLGTVKPRRGESL